MDDSENSIASAVVIPDPEPCKSPPTKRRRSSASDTNSKRPRVSEDTDDSSLVVKHVSPQPTESSKDAPEQKPKDLGPDRRKSSVQEERKRGQRLFGGLISTLSQTTPNGQQKRRLDIEKRQQEKVKQQKAADEEFRAERLAKLDVIRKAEQIKFDEQSMRIRHTNILAMANFLCTKAEPKLYYKPWELLTADENRIKQQVSEAEALIEREVEDFNARHPKDPGTEAAEERESNGTSKETVGEPHAESPSISHNVVDTTNSPVQAPQSKQVTTEKQAHEEHNGEVVVENEEDTVIY